MTDMKKMDFMKAKVFFEKKLPIHISLKNGTFFNGLIDEEPTQDFFFINDREDGRKLIFFIKLNKPIEEVK